MEERKRQGRQEEGGEGRSGEEEEKAERGRRVEDRDLCWARSQEEVGKEQDGSHEQWGGAQTDQGGR